MWATTNANYAPLNDNGTFALNGTRFTVVPEPSLLLQQAAGVGMLVFLAWRRRRASNV
jgi:hypothetical protein